MLWLSFILYFSTAYGLERKMSCSKNPGCDYYDMTLYYLKAQGPNDTLHYLWDFTRRPTVFLAQTDVDDSLNIDCDAFVRAEGKSFNFTKTPRYEFSLIFTKLIEFNDVNDTGILTAQTPRVTYDTKSFSWITESLTKDENHKFVSLTMTANNFTDSEASLTGNFSIQLTSFGFENHDSELPRLLHSPNSTQCKLSLVNLSSSSGFVNSRYAVEFVLVSRDGPDSSSKILPRKNLDDENSPGVFSMVDLMTPKAQDQLFGGAFLQWRPIIYTWRTPSIANSSETVAYNLTKISNPREALFHSLPFMYYGYDIDSYLSEKTVVSMGMTEDGFYKKTNFSSWTFLINFGSPEEEKFSLLVILVMCIGLGLPMLLILVGGTYMCARRIRRNKDELSLER